MNQFNYMYLLTKQQEANFLNKTLKEIIKKEQS